jgi:hypothetical protein
MPHITNRLLAETDYLPPSVNDLLEYDAQLQYESPYIEFDRLHVTVTRDGNLFSIP